MTRSRTGTPAAENNENQTPGHQTPEEQTPGTPSITPPPAAVTQNENSLLSLADLAQRHRVPTWQQAALQRLMQWEEGKEVTDAEYQAALSRLSGRRMGGV